MNVRMLSLFVGLLLCFATGCGIAEGLGQSALPPEPEAVSQPGTDAEPSEPDSADPGDYRIGILTGPRLLREEDVRVAALMRAQYGERVVTASYPANYPDDPAIVVSSTINLAADPLVRVIVIPQSPSGAVQAVKKIRELRDDILFICGSVSERPEEIAAVADIILQTDDIDLGGSAVRRAAELGAEAFVHYGYPRAMEAPLAAARRDRMLETCEAEGIAFAEVDTPDPADDYGTAATTRFLQADIPLRLERYGANTAFFGVDSIMQETLIRGVMEGGAIFPLPCAPSPTTGYPGALGFQVPDDRLTDTGFVIDQILERLEMLPEEDEEEPASLPDEGMEDIGYRLSAWDINVNALIIESGVRYGIAYCENGEGVLDLGLFRDVLSETASEHGGTAFVTTYQAGGKVLDNFFLIRGGYVTF